VLSLNSSTVMVITDTATADTVTTKASRSLTGRGRLPVGMTACTAGLTTGQTHGQIPGQRDGEKIESRPIADLDRTRLWPVRLAPIRPGASAASARPALEQRVNQV
jgi:hypothetical protein